MRSRFLACLTVVMHRVWLTDEIYQQEDRIRTPLEAAGKTEDFDARGAESGALGAASSGTCVDLQFIIESWSRLPGGTKVRIPALVRAGGAGE
jgi:hypothetical protein